jgi:hypothetical protein
LTIRFQDTLDVEVAADDKHAGFVVFQPTQLAT